MSVVVVDEVDYTPPLIDLTESFPKQQSNLSYDHYKPIYWCGGGLLLLVYRWYCFVVIVLLLLWKYCWVDCIVFYYCCWLGIYCCGNTNDGEV